MCLRNGMISLTLISNATILLQEMILSAELWNSGRRQAFDVVISIMNLYHRILWDILSLMDIVFAGKEKSLVMFLFNPFFLFLKFV